MVHLVTERPREALLPIFIQQCRYPGRRRKQSSWSIALPVYYELLCISCNVIFLLGSILFLPDIFQEWERSVRFSMAIQNVDKDELLLSNHSMLAALEQNITQAVAAEAGGLITAEDTSLLLGATKSCSLHDAMIFDFKITPPKGVNATDLQFNLTTTASIPEAVNTSILTLDMGSLMKGPLGVSIISAPRVIENPIPNRWSLDLGCYLFIFGSVLLAALTFYDLLEDVLICIDGRGWLRFLLCNFGGYNQLRAAPCEADAEAMKKVASAPPKERHGSDAFGEKCLYLAGSIVFAVGTLYWQHPKKVAERIPTLKEADVLVGAIGMFIVGSVTFAFAAFLNALSLMSRNRTFTNWAVLICGVYELGAILFAIGSVCFMPNQGCGKGMELLGAWCFIFGSLCYVLGGCIEVMKTMALLYLGLKQEEAAQTIKTAVAIWMCRQRLMTAVDPHGDASSAGVESPEGVTYVADEDASDGAAQCMPMLSSRSTEKADGEVQTGPSFFEPGPPRFGSIEVQDSQKKPSFFGTVRKALKKHTIIRALRSPSGEFTSSRSSPLSAG